jgi:hypothetical protein
VCGGSVLHHQHSSTSVVQLTIIDGAVTNDVGAGVLRSPGGCGEDCGCSEGEEGIGTPAGVCARVCACCDASDIACASVTILVVVDPLVVSSDRTDCIRIDGDGGVSFSCYYRELCDP